MLRIETQPGKVWEAWRRGVLLGGVDVNNFDPLSSQTASRHEKGRGAIFALEMSPLRLEVRTAVSAIA